MNQNKRFYVRSYDGINCHIFDRSIVIAEVHKEDINNLCNLLNELEEENEQLKKELKFIKSELSNIRFVTRQRTLNEVKEEIEKLERYE